MELRTKVCNKCLLCKPLFMYNVRGDSVDGYYKQCKECALKYTLEWRKNNPEKCKIAKQKYYASVYGKAQKAKEDKAYTESGKRALVEQKRAQKPLSEARVVSKRVYQLKRYSIDKNVDDFSKFVLSEAVSLARLRKKLLNTEWHVDHIIPVSKDGSSTFDNIQVVPGLWNRQKSNKHFNRYFGGTK